MSIQSNAGAAAAAVEIKRFIQQKKAEYADKPEVVAALTEIEEKAKDIEETAKDGWY
jgi:hypothetical protein